MGLVNYWLFQKPVSLEGVSVGKLLLKNLLFNVFWVPVTVQKLIKTNLE